MEIFRAKEIMKNNFIGPNELNKIHDVLDLDIPKGIPDIPFSEEDLLAKCETHLLILCVDKFKDDMPVNIINIKQRLEKVSSPKFYNQDWYLKEKFIEKSLQMNWKLIRKALVDESRGLNPEGIRQKYYLNFAVELVYAFFVNYLVNDGEKLWNHDYVWCSDFDDKGDQIYVGRYTDASGLNADGFEIHRHLRIKENYGAI